MFHHEGCQLAVQIAEEDYVAFAHLVEYAHKISFAVSSSLGGFHGRDVWDVAIIANGIVVDEIAYVFYQTVVAYGYIA